MVDRLLMLLAITAKKIGGPEYQMESEFYLQALSEWYEPYRDLASGNVTGRSRPSA
jgi:hypothetical protein